MTARRPRACFPNTSRFGALNELRPGDVQFTLTFCRADGMVGGTENGEWTGLICYVRMTMAHFINECHNSTTFLTLIKR